MKQLPDGAKKLAVVAYAIGKALLGLMSPGIVLEEKRYILEKQRRDFIDEFGVDLEAEVAAADLCPNKGEAK